MKQPVEQLVNIFVVKPKVKLIIKNSKPNMTNEHARIRTCIKFTFKNKRKKKNKIIKLQ